MYTERKEASVTYSIITQLENLGWIIDEKDPNCNVTQQRAKTVEQTKLLRNKFPDFVLYRKATNIPIGIIEAKKPKKSLTEALNEAKEKYAKPLKAPLVFAYNDTYVETYHIYQGRPLKIDGEDVRQFIDHYTALRFVEEGAEIFSAPKNIQHSREQLIKIFKRAADFLREAGIQAGGERFGVFSDILFLKIMDEVCELKEHAREKPPIPIVYRWKHFESMNASDLHIYMRDSIWGYMNKKYGSIFSDSLLINSPEILKDIVTELSNLNLISTQTDVKGDAFEYFLKNAYQGIKIKDLGEYFTPRNIVATMVSMVDPKFGEKIYDPFCGTGGFLIKAFKYLEVRTKLDKEREEILTNETIYGSEITTNARIAKMNMILAGDGHTNIQRLDSLANPRNGEFDIVLTNPPFSQKTRYGNLYSVPSKDGDATCIIHCFDSLNNNGRAAIVVKEDFLTEGGDIGKVRKYIMEKAKNFSVVSLPRRIFEPYSAAKTSIIYFEKDGKRKTTFFYAIKNVGYTLGPRRKDIKDNDIPLALDAFKEEKKSENIDSCVVDNSLICEERFQKNYSLWLYDYFEITPKTPYNLAYLGNYIEERKEKTFPREHPDEEFVILGVDYIRGCYVNDILLGSRINQAYKQVFTGDIVYNPHRVNIGSIGLVTPHFNRGYVSNIYVVFRSINDKVPPSYIWALLKSNTYRKIIQAYDSKHGAVRPNLVYKQLCRILIPILPKPKLDEFMKKQEGLNELMEEIENKQESIFKFADGLISIENKID
ncbi:MAG: N-6 DNA methylase [candidate division Zixibacteria bacterium]|nr:N-6 DNA methylase [candidate division Zixibacteria bacterium]